MDLVFIRHGEGEHGVDLPRSLAIVDPALTDRGREQVQRLCAELAIGDQDLLVVSPTRRTIETALILGAGTAAPGYVTPAVGPRIFPLRPGAIPLACDTLLDAALIGREFPDLEIRDLDLWPGGINTMEAERFEPIGRALIAWCRQQGARRALVIAHDGTIHNYRQLLGERGLTRATFLGPAGCHRVTA